MANIPHPTPGVFVQEKDAFPPSIVGVDTAVPVFIGYTKKADQNGHSIRMQPVRINSMADYMAIFGGAFQHLFRLTEVTDGKGNPASEVVLGGKHYRLDLTKRFYLYNSMQLFYANGGGSCYVVSVGDYDDQITKAALIDSGLAAVKDLVGPTMLVIPEAVLLGDACAEVAQAMLKQCLSQTDRLALLDVWGADALPPAFDTDELASVIMKFRNGVAGLGEALKYGAAYFPFLRTSVTNPKNTNEVSFTNLDSDLLSVLLSAVAVAVGDSNAKLLSQTIKLKSGDQDYEENKKRISQVLSAKLPAVQDMYSVMAEKIGILPPSGAMAGVYTRNDNMRLVWNAPANIIVAEVTGPTVKISDRMQQDLNVPIDGLAVNAIRDISGRGTVVWGARTLDGNSNDWRYIQVRRSTIYIEQSVKLALNQFVFAPNVAQTWVTVTSMVGGFLKGIWAAGGLMGATSKDAFWVSCGLGSTMTAQDILDGYMNVMIGLQMVRPGEFIELRFRQQMQGAAG